MPCVGFSACSRCSAMRSARAFTCSGLGFSFSARSACSSCLSSSATRPVLGCMSWSWMALVVRMRNLLAWSQSLGMSASSSHGTAPAQPLGLLSGHLFGVLAQPAALEDVRVPGLARGLQRHVDDLLGCLELLGAVAPPPLVTAPHVGPRVHELAAQLWRMVGPVGFDLAARVALSSASLVVWPLPAAPGVGAAARSWRRTARPGGRISGRVRGGWRSAGCCCA